jgi:hypothetical protein
MNPLPARLRRAIALAVLLLPAALTAARAEITPDARQALDRYFQATGGRAAFDAIRSVHIAYRITALGLAGASESWTRTPDRRATETRLGPFTIQDGFDGKVAWRTVPGNEQPVLLDGIDLEDARTSAYYENERWMTPDQGGGTVRVADTERDSSNDYTVLEVIPPGAKSAGPGESPRHARRFYVNQKTGFIDRATTRRDQNEIVSRFSDYRPTPGGRLVAFRQLTQIVGMPANDLLLEVDSVQVNPDIPDSRFAFPSAAESRTRWLETPGVARLPLRYSARHLWLTASVNGGEPVDFIYDTGASLTVIDSAFAARVGLATEGKLQGQGAGAMGMATFSKLQSLKVAGPDGDGVEIREQKVAVLSINGFLAPFFWRDCAGVIGYDFISRFVSEVDYEKQTLTLRDPQGFEYRGAGKSIPFTLAATVPVVRMKIDGAYEGGFRVDLGSSSTVDLHGPFVKQHGLDTKHPEGIEVTGGGFGGTFTNRLVRMKTLELGPFSWKRPLVSLSGAQSGAFASQDYAGNIGNHILERFKITLDYERRLLYLEPTARFAEPDRFSRAGVQLARYGDVVSVMQSLPGSPAAKAGLAPGDQVVAIDGKPILDYTPQTLMVLFDRGAVGRAVVFDVRRGTKTEKVTVKLAEIL